MGLSIPDDKVFQSVRERSTLKSDDLYNPHMLSILSTNTPFESNIGYAEERGKGFGFGAGGLEEAGFKVSDDYVSKPRKPV